MKIKKPNNSVSTHTVPVFNCCNMNISANAVSPCCDLPPGPCHSFIGISNGVSALSMNSGEIVFNFLLKAFSFFLIPSCHKVLENV